MRTKMKNKKSAGHDGISYEILKRCSPIIEPFSVEIFEKSIDQGVLPSSLKLAKIIPLYKKEVTILILKTMDQLAYQVLFLKFTSIFCSKEESFAKKMKHCHQNNLVSEKKLPVLRQ